MIMLEYRRFQDFTDRKQLQRMFDKLLATAESILEGHRVDVIGENSDMQPGKFYVIVQICRGFGGGTMAAAYDTEKDANDTINRIRTEMEALLPTPAKEVHPFTSVGLMASIQTV